MSDLGMNPWLSIWTKPKETVRTIIDHNPKYRFFVLSFLYGLPTVLQLAQNLSLGSVFSLPAILLAVLIISPILGCIGLLLCSLFITWTGKWIGGRGSFLEMRCAISWTNSTNLVTVLVWMGMIFQFKEVIFYEGFVRMPMTVSEASVLTLYFFIQLIVSIWSLILLFFAVSEVHRFSVWKAVLNVLLAFLVGVGVSWVLVFILERVADLRV